MKIIKVIQTETRILPPLPLSAFTMKLNIRQPSKCEMNYSVEISLSSQTYMLIGLYSVISLFVNSSTVSVEQLILVCLGVWGLLSVQQCQSTGATDVLQNTAAVTTY